MENSLVTHDFKKYVRMCKQVCLVDNLEAHNAPLFEKKKLVFQF